MTTTMSWMIGVMAIMVAYAVAAVVGWNVHKKNKDQ